MALALNGTVLSGRFQVEERVGLEGRFEIFRAVEVSSRRRVIVRILDLEERSDVTIHPEIGHCAKQIMSLTHPGLLPVIDCGGHRARPYLVTPAIEAQTLEKLLQNGMFPPISEALKLLAQITEALEHAHRGGVVHGDLTAANILVPREGRPLLTDVGVAHWADLATSRSRPQHVPPPLRPATADLEALRRLAERLVNAPISRPSIPVIAPPAPVQSSGSLPVNGAWSVPEMNQRVSMPAMKSATPSGGSRISTPASVPIAAAVTPSQPPAPIPSQPPMAAPQPSQPPVPSLAAALKKAVDSTAETEVLPIVPPMSTGQMPFIESSAVIAIEPLPPEPKVVALTNVPSDTLLLPQLPGPGGAHFSREMEEEPTGAKLTPRYVIIARRAATRGRDISLELFEKVRSKIENWAQKSDHVAKIVSLANEGWRRFAALFEERAPKPLGEEDAAEPSVVDLRAAGLGGWYGWPRNRRIAVAAGGAASLLLMLVLVSGPSDDAEALPMETESMAITESAPAVAPAAAAAAAVSEAPPAPKKSNVDRLRERKKKK